MRLTWWLILIMQNGTQLTDLEIWFSITKEESQFKMKKALLNNQKLLELLFITHKILRTTQYLKESTVYNMLLRSNLRLFIQETLL